MRVTDDSPGQQPDQRAASPARPAGPALLTQLDATAARRWAVLSRSALATHRRAIDALNVFPVPDADTGTNLYLTLDAAMAAARDDAGHQTGLAESAGALARATLSTARGNSGVILSQVLRGLAEVAAQESAAAAGGALGPAGVARALRRASDLASASVTRPAPGTILSVAERSAAAAEGVAAAGGSLDDVTQAALAAARAALAGTTAELAELAAAGVVDAGALGYVLLLDALASVVRGTELDSGPLARLAPGGGAEAGSGGGAEAGRKAEAETDRTAASAGASAGQVDPAGSASHDGAADGGALPAYELMYVLADSSQERADELAAALGALGDSVIVAGGEAEPERAAGGSGGPARVWRVHAHLRDVGAGIEAGMRTGRPQQIRVTALPDASDAPAAPRRPATVGVAAWTRGPGLARLVAEAGGVPVVSAHGSRPSTGDFLSAVEACGTSAVLVLPNDVTLRAAAEAVVEIAADRGITVHVLRSRSTVQGLAALAVFDARAGLQDNLLAMASAAAATRHGAVTVATREALTSAGWCYRGDVLGIVDGDVATIGPDLARVAGGVVDRLLGSGGEILTVVAGADAPAGLADEVAAAARRRRRDVEVTVLDGGQPEHHLLLGVE